MGQDLLLGIDIGTYESKGVLTTPQGKVIAQAAIPHKLLFPRAGWAEHDPELTWWGDFCNLSKQLLATEGVSPSDIKGVGVSAIGPDVLPIDENFNPLRMGILYGVDTRAVEEIDELNAIYGEDTIQQQILYLRNQLVQRFCGLRKTNQRFTKKRVGLLMQQHLLLLA